MDHITLEDLQARAEYLRMDKVKDFPDQPAPLYHEQEYPLALVDTFGHRLDFWEDRTLQIAFRLKKQFQ